MAAERYVLVCHATRAKRLCGVVRVRYIVVVIFIVTLLFSLPFAFRYRTVWTPSQVDLLSNNATNTTSHIISAVHIEVSSKVNPVVRRSLQFVIRNMSNNSSIHLRYSLESHSFA